MSPRSNPTKFTKPADEAVSRSRRSKLNIVDVVRLLNEAAENNLKGLPASKYGLKGVVYVLFAARCVTWMLQVWAGSHRVSQNVKILQWKTRSCFPDSLGIGQPRLAGVTGRQVWSKLDCLIVRERFTSNSRVKAPQGSEVTRVVGIGLLNHTGFYVGPANVFSLWLIVTSGEQASLSSAMYAFNGALGVNEPWTGYVLHLITKKLCIIHCPLNISTTTAMSLIRMSTDTPSIGDRHKIMSCLQIGVYGPARCASFWYQVTGSKNGPTLDFFCFWSRPTLNNVSDHQL